MDDGRCLQSTFIVVQFKCWLILIGQSDFILQSSVNICSPYTTWGNHRYHQSRCDWKLATGGEKRWESSINIYKHHLYISMCKNRIIIGHVRIIARFMRVILWLAQVQYIRVFVSWLHLSRLQAVSLATQPQWFASYQQPDCWRDYRALNWGALFGTCWPWKRSAGKPPLRCFRNSCCR